MMDEGTQHKLQGITEGYRAELRRIADNTDLGDAEKQDRARAAHRTALEE